MPSLVCYYYRTMPCTATSLRSTALLLCYLAIPHPAYLLFANTPFLEGGPGERHTPLRPDVYLTTTGQRARRRARRRRAVKGQRQLVPLENEPSVPRENRERMSLLRRLVVCCVLCDVCSVLCARCAVCGVLYIVYKVVRSEAGGVNRVQRFVFRGGP